MSELNFRELGRQLSNWGRWGPEDERGTLNHILAADLVAAAALVRDGKVFDLGIPFDSQGPQAPGSSRTNPILVTSETGHGQNLPGNVHYADDYVFMPLQAATQWDALAHVYYDGALYNGFSSESITARGAARCSIDRLGNGIAGRGVLLDIARMRGVPWLDPSDSITAADLDAACNVQAVEVRRGDVVLVRTGWRRKFVMERDAAAWSSPQPGLGLDCCPWLADHEVAAVGSDNRAVEALPARPPGTFLPVHMVLIRDMGMPLAEILDLERLADACAADSVWEFFLCAPPIKFTGAVGSPVNPLAIK